MVLRVIEQASSAESNWVEVEAAVCLAKGVSDHDVPYPGNKLRV